MPCTSSSKKRTGQPWAQPGHRARTNDPRGEQPHHGLGDVLPPRGLQKRTQGYRRLASSQAPLRASQAMQTCQADRRLPREARRANAQSMAVGGHGQGMVASVGQSACQRSHDAAVVRGTRARQPPSPSRRIATCRKPPNRASAISGAKWRRPQAIPPNRFHATNRSAGFCTADQSLPSKTRISTTIKIVPRAPPP